MTQRLEHKRLVTTFRGAAPTVREGSQPNPRDPSIYIYLNSNAYFGIKHMTNTYFGAKKYVNSTYCVGYLEAQPKELQFVHFSVD